jgi:hypothetical protein
VHFAAANGVRGPALSLQKIPDSPELRLTLRRGALRLAHRRFPRHRKFTIRIGLAFSDLLAAPEYGGNQTIVLRAG